MLRMSVLEPVLEVLELFCSRKSLVQELKQLKNCSSRTLSVQGERTGLMVRLERWTPNRETWVRTSAGSVCCFLEQETFTPQKYC